MPQLLRLDHVQVTVPRASIDATREFYGAILGLREIAKPGELAGRGGAWYQLGEVQVHVGIEDVPAPRSRRHLCFVVADLQAFETRLQGRGVAIIADEQPIAGWRRCYVLDPGGNRLELAEPDHP